jgi:hypothetical protein
VNSYGYKKLIRLVAIGSLQVGLLQVGLLQVGLLQVGLLQVGLLKHLAAKEINCI